MSTWKWLLERDLNFFFAGLLPLSCGRCLIQFRWRRRSRSERVREGILPAEHICSGPATTVCVRNEERVLLGTQHRGMGLLGPIGTSPDASLTRAAE